MAYSPAACTASKLFVLFSCVPGVDEATREHRGAAEDLQRDLYTTAQQLGGGGRQGLFPTGLCRLLFNPFRAPKPLPILNPSIFVHKNGFAVVKGLTAA